MKIKTHQSHKQNNIQMKTTPIDLIAHKRTCVIHKYKAETYNQHNSIDNKTEYTA